MYILTGGAGFIGSNILKALNARGVQDIVVVDNLTRGEKFKNLVGAKFADYIDKNDFLPMLEAGKFKKITAVIHQGACSDTTERDGKYMMRNNYSYSVSLASHCIFHEVPFIYASSASVYGNGECGFRESFECEAPINVYAYSKYLFDQWVRAHFEEASPTFVGLRYFNVYGYGEFHKGRMRSMVSQAFEQIEATGKIKLFTDGEQSRDFVFVDDVVDIVLFFLDNHGKKGIFNVGTGSLRTFNDLARTVISACERGEIEYIPFPEDLRGKYQNRTQADLTALRAAGYSKDFTSLENGVTEYVEQLRKIRENVVNPTPRDSP